MCGIYCALSVGNVPNHANIPKELLKRRGPDSCKEHTITVTNAQGELITVYLFSTVLSLRGDAIVSQPLVDEKSGSSLCWNGEAWSIDGKAVSGNDSVAVFSLLLQASTDTSGSSKVAAISALTGALSRIRGPYAFVFYDARHQLLLFGRDALGRRSLVQISDPTGNLVLSSICGTSPTSWAEVEADGAYAIDLSASANGSSSDYITKIPLTRASEKHHEALPTLRYHFPCLNRSLPNSLSRDIANFNSSVAALGEALRQALEVRVTDIRPRIHQMSKLDSNGLEPAEVAILFSGGLDCTVLARMVHDILPEALSIDLLNVAFENPRIHRQRGPGLGDTLGSNLKSPYEECPDRITTRSSHLELSSICPGRRWNLVEINVPYDETVAHRDTIKGLMHPHNTEMDLSIACALYFASRGIGIVKRGERHMPYTSSARVLLSGLGADELFGGYQRHATAYNRRGYEGLLDELELDINRLGKRNLGRDDRVMAHWGKEVRFPYLDEGLLSWALACPVWQKCGFSTRENGLDVADGPDIEPGKRVLRLLAWKLGMTGVAMEKKRAIQFGARTAKMEHGKVKGTQVLS